MRVATVLLVILLSAWIGRMREENTTSVVSSLRCPAVSSWMVVATTINQLYSNNSRGAPWTLPYTPKLAGEPGLGSASAQIIRSCGMVENGRRGESTIGRQQ